MLSQEANLKKILRPPLYVPELKKIDALIAQMMQGKHDIAICVDEFGGTSGVVTHEEIIEAIFGQIPDEEHEERDEEWYKKEGAYYLIEGSAPLYEVSKLLETNLRGEYADTLSGYLLDLFDEIPEEGRAVTHQNIEFIISKIEKNRILEVKVRILKNGNR